MRIVSCVSAVSEIAPLAEAGAAEFYCALEAVPSFGPGHLRNLKELKTAVDRAHEAGAKLSLAANFTEMVGTERRCRDLMRNIVEIDSLGIDNFIVANPAFFLMLEEHVRRTGIKGLRAGFHLSSVQPCFNHLALKLFLKFGFSRVILPTQLSAAEAAQMLGLCAREGIETEIFDYRFFGCAYVNGWCHIHGPYFHTFRTRADGSGFCQAGVYDEHPVELRARDVAAGREREAGQLLEKVRRRVRHGGPDRISNAASFFDYYTAGVHYVKYGTRADPADLKIIKVKQMRSMLALAGELIREHGAVRAREEFVSRMERWRWDKVALR